MDHPHFFPLFPLFPRGVEVHSQPLHRCPQGPAHALAHGARMLQLPQALATQGGDQRLAMEAMEAPEKKGVPSGKARKKRWNIWPIYS